MDLYYTDPAQHHITAGQELDDLDRHLSDLSDLDRDVSDLSDISDLDRDLSALDRDLSDLDRDLSYLHFRRARVRFGIPPHTLVT